MSVFDHFVDLALKGFTLEVKKDLDFVKQVKATDIYNIH